MNGLFEEVVEEERPTGWGLYHASPPIWQEKKRHRCSRWCFRCCCLHLLLPACMRPPSSPPAEPKRPPTLGQALRPPTPGQGQHRPIITRPPYFLAQVPPPEELASGAADVLANFSTRSHYIEVLPHDHS